MLSSLVPEILDDEVDEDLSNEVAFALETAFLSLPEPKLDLPTVLTLEPEVTSLLLLIFPLDLPVVNAD